MTDLPPSESSSEPVDPAGPPDPVDELLRRTMRALDTQTPAATFDALPLAVEAAIDAGDSRGFAELVAERGQGGGRRRGSSAPIPAGGKLVGSSGLFATAPASAGSAASSAAQGEGELSGGPDVALPRSARAKRRSLLETQVGAPLAWWQTRTAAVALVGVSLVAAAVLVVLRQSGGHRPEESISASSDKLRDPVRRRPPAPRPPALSPEQQELRQQLAGVLPKARACVGARPLDEVALAIELDASGLVRAVTVRGELASPGAQACIVEALGTVVVSSWLGSTPKIEIPLFE